MAIPTVDSKVANLVTQLSRYYWTPVHPNHYVLTVQPGNKRYGIGTIAYRDYGLFNLTWALFPLNSVEGHNQAMAFFLRHVDKLPDIDGTNLSTWLTLLGPQEFCSWFEANQQKIPTNYVRHLQQAIHVLERVRIIQRPNSV